MRTSASEFSEGMQQFGTIVGWLMAGGVIGVLLGQYFAPGSQLAMFAGALLFPATVVLGWMLMFPLAVLMLPFAIPAFIRWLRDPLPAPRKAEDPRPPRKATAVGWLFVLAAVPTSLVAGFIAGAPFWYLLAGLLYGYAMRHSARLQDVHLQ